MEQFYDNYLSFTQEIDKNSSLRKMELSEVHRLINDSEFENTTKIHIVRSSIPLLYAHYEGFLKFIFGETILFLKNLNLSIKNLKPKFLIISTLIYIDENTTNQYAKSKKLIDMFDYIMDETNDNFFNVFKNESSIKNFKIDHRTFNEALSLLSIENQDIYETINTNMDLKSSVGASLRKTSPDYLNLEVTRFFIDTKNSFLEKLYNRRNTFAHGDLASDSNQQFSLERLSDSTFNASKEYFNESFDTILLLMELIKATIFDYIENRNFLVTR